MALIKSGHLSEAVDAANKAIEVEPPFGIKGKVLLGIIYATGGQNNLATDVLHELEQAKRSGNREISDYDIAIIYAAMGERTRSFECLKNEADLKGDQMLFINSDPLLDPLRSDPHFDKIKSQLNQQMAQL